MENQYFNEGRYSAEVAAQVEPLERNRVAIDFNIDEGSIAKIKQVSVVGNRAFEEKELRTNIEMALYKHRMEKEREKLVNDLKQALAAVKLLSGLLPICASCKKIRDDNGYWSEVENYISLHSDADFTHGYCPECADKVLSGYLKDQAKQDAPTGGSSSA